MNRPGLQALLNDARQGKLDVVVNGDRLSRRLKYLLDIIELLHGLGVRFVSATEPLDTTTGGTAAVQMLGTFAEFERGMIRDRVLAWRRASRRATTRARGTRRPAIAAQVRQDAQRRGWEVEGPRGSYVLFTFGCPLSSEHDRGVAACSRRSGAAPGVCTRQSG